jgi:adenosylhomocysteine nucleosidase
MKSKIPQVRVEVGTLVCFALEQEAAPFRRLAVRIPDIAILITGIGPRNAETSVRRFLAQHLTKRVFTCGFCGGLDPDLEVGEVVYMTGYPALEERLLDADARLATFVSAPRIATTVADKQLLRAATRADVVDMESEEILEVCRERRIPCAMVRAVSDTAGEDLPLDFNALVRPDLSLHHGRLAWAIVQAPWKIFALLRLHRRTSFAAQQLAHVLAKVIW